MRLLRDEEWNCSQRQKHNKTNVNTSHSCYILTHFYPYYGQKQLRTLNRKICNKLTFEFLIRIVIRYGCFLYQLYIQL